MFCSKCGSLNDDNAFKCVQCGTVMQIVPPPIVPVKNNNAPIVIIAVVVGFIFLIGILVAIAIPRFVAYNERVKNLGGLQLILDVKVDKAVENHIGQAADELQNDLRKKQILFQELVPKGTTGIDITLMRKEDENVFKNLIATGYRDFDLQPGPSKENRDVFQLILRDQVKMQIKRLAYDQVLTIVRNRASALDIKLTDIHPQKEARILVQLAGFKDPQKAIELIAKTALLEFRLLDEENMASANWQNAVPADDEILYGMEINDNGEKTKRPYLVRRQALLNGEYLKEARQTISNQTSQAMVSLSFDDQGAKKFEQITADNVGKRLAIVLDGMVYSAPVIREKITGGNAVITGNFTDEEAKDLAIVLKAGALPVPVELIENRPIGSSPVVQK